MTFGDLFSSLALAAVIAGSNMQQAHACSTRVFTYIGFIGADADHVDIRLPTIGEDFYVIVRLKRLDVTSFALEIQNERGTEPQPERPFVPTDLSLNFDEEGRQYLAPLVSFQPNSEDFDTSRSFVTITFSDVTVVSGNSATMELATYSQHSSECMRQGQENALNANGGVNNVLTTRGVADIPGLDRLTEEELARVATAIRSN